MSHCWPHTYSQDDTKIQASQGHSVAVDLDLSAASPPPFLYYGTVSQALESIRASGLQRMQRHHVHLSAIEKNSNSGWQATRKTYRTRHSCG